MAVPCQVWSIMHLAACVMRGCLVVCALLCTACSGVPASSEAGDARVAWQAGPVRLEQGLNSLRARRDAGVVRQQHDYSCGSAALATLLSYGLNEPVSEQQLLAEILASLSADEIAVLQRNGLSLAELQALAQRHGHRAQGFRIHALQLEKVLRPVIVFIRPGGYDHFAVLKRVRDGKVDLADPSLGNVRMPLYRFLEMWSDPEGYGVLMAVEPAGGHWPAHYALQAVGNSGPASEQQRVLRLESGGGDRSPAASGR